MVLFNRDRRWVGLHRDEVLRGLAMLLMFVGVVCLLVFAYAMDLQRRERLEVEHVAIDGLFLDAVRVDCPDGPAYAHASECIRSRRGVGFLFVDDNGVPRVVSVVGVGRIE